MKPFKIKGHDGESHLVNFEAFIVVEFQDETREIVFDDILRIPVPDDSYASVKKNLLKQVILHASTD